MPSLICICIASSLVPIPFPNHKESTVLPNGQEPILCIHNHPNILSAIHNNILEKQWGEVEVKERVEERPHES